MKELKPKESLHDWVERLADKLELSVKQREAMHEVCKQSYIKGTDAAFNVSSENLLHYTAEFADNGYILRDTNASYTEVIPFAGKDDPFPFKVALGKMLYDDIKEVEKQFDDVEYCGYDLTISIKPLQHE